MKNTNTKTAVVMNPDGAKFGVKVISKGDQYGLDDCLTHGEADPLVEFYFLGRDAAEEKKMKKIHGVQGYFVSRYYLRTLADQPENGVCLSGADSKMWIDHNGVKEAIRLARTF